LNTEETSSTHPSDILTEQTKKIDLSENLPDRSSVNAYESTTINLPLPLILIAEDNEANIITVSSYLEAKDYRVVIAKNGSEAIAITKSDRPDLILMDIQMPVMDGLEAIAQIRLDPSLANIPIIALTALTMEGDRDRCLAIGANEYISKPIKLKQLILVIQKLLKR
jgi:CheY-like chemotaxis protein